jgi:hypothetical protein
MSSAELSPSTLFDVLNVSECSAHLCFLFLLCNFMTNIHFDLKGCQIFFMKLKQSKEMQKMFTTLVVTSICISRVYTSIILLFIES